MDTESTGKGQSVNGNRARLKMKGMNAGWNRSYSRVGWSKQKVKAACSQTEAV